MAGITIANVSIDFPIYSARTRSIRTNLVRRIGGKIQKAGSDEHAVIRALNNINLTLHPGDRLGLIGPNGSGKSTLLRVMSGVYEPLIGNVQIDGQVSSLLDVSLGIDPELNGYDNIILRSTLLGSTIAESRAQTKEIAEFSELAEFLDFPVRTYSSGMLLQLAFAISTATRPDIILLDENFGVGDASFAKKARDRLFGLIENASILVLASHDTQLLGSLCNQIASLRGGEIIETGPVDKLLPRHLDFFKS